MSYQNPSRKQSSRLSTPVRLGVVAVAACFIAAPVFSNPVNPVVVNGTASFNQAGNLLTVTNSNGAIINWDKFSIKVGETTHFAQTAASSSVMNRVLNDPTVIYGTLSSNGRVFLVNPAGIMVGPGGRVDTAGFVASTLNIRNEDFLAGRNLFINDGGAKDVINQGEIRTPAGGSVYLIGSNVTNEGIITTPSGETILAAGATVSLIDSATPGVKVDITGAAGNATNLGTITAEAGRIGIAGVIVRNSGTLNASSVVNEGGRIFLKASQDAYVDGNGRIVTTGTKGGSVEVLGNRVAVTDNAEIDASGTNGGGRIMVGGDYQGKNPEIQNASVTYFGPNASLKADATEVGDGGTVIVWADDTTRAYGSISARGGANGGNGGFVETSGHRSLSITGARVDTRAPNGKTGNWLLDPADVTIMQYGGTPTSGGVSAPFTLTTTGSVVYGEDISFALGTTSVTIQTGNVSGGIGDIAMTGANILGATGSLTLAAYGGGAATGNIDITGSNINITGGFKALAGWNGATTYFGSDVIAGTGNINISQSQIRSSGNIDLHAGKDITLGHTSTAPGTWIQSGGAMSVSAGYDLTLLGGSGGIWHITSLLGPGVMLQSAGTQTITAVNQILLQAGSFDNTQYGGNMSAGSVGIWSDADQTISANVIKLYAGATGHDNAAGFHAYGSQTINITGMGGLLELRGGGDSDPTVYGGAGSYNNQARIEHGQWYADNSYYGSGVQTITIYGGGSVNLQAGSGTGALGYYSSDCYATPLGEACRGSSNDAAIYNGFGSQTLNFVDGGPLAITGGSAGTQNWAGINNQLTATTQTVNGYPTITVTGGSGGGSALSYGGNTFQLSNDAGINSKGTGDQTVYAGSITVNAGNATYGGAGFGNYGGISLAITTTGDLSMYGGTSSAGDPFASGAYIGNEHGGAIGLNVGGNLYIQSGSGTSSPVMIGSLNSSSTVTINTGGSATIIADGSGVGIGSGPWTNPGPDVGIGSGVSITARNGINISSPGSVYTGGDLVATEGDVYIKAARNVMVDGTLDASGSIDIRAGFDPSSSFTASSYGGDIVLGATSLLTAQSDVYLYTAAGSAAYGDITQYGGSINAGSWVTMFSAGNTTIHGSIVAQDLSIGAGLQYRSDGYGYGTSHGGNLSFGAGSNVQVGNNAYLATSGGTRSVGNITQDAAASMTVGYRLDINGFGDVRWEGTTIAGYSAGKDGPADIYIRAGYDVTDGGSAGWNAGSYTTSIARSVPASAWIGTINNVGGYVGISATGAISASSIVANDVFLYSIYGGASGGLAISANTQATGALSAAVSSSAEYGGISITNTGPQPTSSISMTDDAAYQPSIYFHNSGDLILDGTTSFATTNTGDISIATDGDLMAVDKTISSTGNLNVTAASSIELFRSTFEAGGNITATSGGDVRLNNGSSISAGQDVHLTFNGLNSTLYLNEYAPQTTNSLAGGYNWSPSKINSVTTPPSGPTTTYLEFALRSSGGVVIDGIPTTSTVDGQSGFYIYAFPNTVPAAAPNAGLEITYGIASSFIDICMINLASCVPPKPPEPPPPPPPCAGCGGGGLQPHDEIGGGEDQFGGSPSGGNGKDEKKDEKDKKDKKSDEAKDEKKDEKPAQKKVAQCS